MEVTATEYTTSIYAIYFDLENPEAKASAHRGSAELNHSLRAHYKYR